MNKSDVVNNLTSTSTDKPLSANMGKTLNDNVKTKVSVKIPTTSDGRYFNVGFNFVAAVTRTTIYVIHSHQSGGDWIYPDWQARNA